jgi:glutathione-specific gamma-glutamylcyclotransferase
MQTRPSADPAGNYAADHSADRAAAVPLTREVLADHAGRTAMLRERLGKLARTDAQMDDCLRDTLARKPGSATGDVWLFGYGSLIWNPLVQFTDKAVATVYGYHRKFCLYSRVNRGTPASPGLVLGLDKGGSCTGVAYRIAPELVWPELSLVWRREMLMGSYTPTWAAARLADGQRMRVLTFVVQPGHPASACNLDEDAAAVIIASANGLHGSCAAYLHQTVDSLKAHGIRDKALERLGAKVMAL